MAGGASVKDELAAALSATFPDTDAALDSGVRLTCPSGILGDVVLLEDEVGVIVEIEGWTHGHFDHFDDESENIDAAVRFVSDLIEGRVVVWSVGDGSMGGWCYTGHGAMEIEFPADARFATWTREVARDEF